MSRVHAPVGAATAVAPGASMPQTSAARTASAAGRRAAATAASAAQADSRTGRAAQRGAHSSRPTPRTGSRPHRGRSADGAEPGGERRRPWRFENQPRASTHWCDELLDRAARADVEAEKAAGPRGEVREIVDHRAMVDGINCALAPALADARVYDEDYIVLTDRRGPATAAARLDRTWPAWDAATFEHLVDMWRVRDPSTGQVCARGFAHARNGPRARDDWRLACVSPRHSQRNIYFGWVSFQQSGRHPCVARVAGVRRPYIRGLSGRVWNAAVFERALAMIAAGLKVRHEINPAATAWGHRHRNRRLRSAPFPMRSPTDSQQDTLSHQRRTFCSRLRGASGPGSASSPLLILRGTAVPPCQPARPHPPSRRRLDSQRRNVICGAPPIGPRLPETPGAETPQRALIAPPHVI